MSESLSGNGTYLMNTDIANLRSDRLHVQGEISGSNTLVISAEQYDRRTAVNR